MNQLAVMKQALEAIHAAIQFHGVVLTSDPPQDAWKYHRVSERLHEARTALDAAIKDAKDKNG